MDPVILVTDHIDIYQEFKESGETLTTDQIIKLQQVKAINDLAMVMEQIAKAIQQISI